MQPVQKVENVLSHFEKTWETLFTSPVHLDSALSKLPVRYKSILAQIFPAILLRPTSLAEELGVGVPQGEPWRVSPEKLRRWRPAAMMADRLYASMVEGFPVVTPVREDFPSGMIQELEESWGGKVTDELVSILAGDPPLSLRVSRQVGVDALLEGLTAKKKLPVSVKRSELVPFGLRLSGYAPVLQTEWYEKGAFEIQDEGSQFMALFALWPEVFGKMLTRAPGAVKLTGQPALTLPDLSSKNSSKTIPKTIIDACAGAGGKSLAMADVLKGRGRIFAYDVSAKKLQALTRRMTRAGLNNIQTITLEEGKESEKLAKFKESADLVLVDSPCSGWGVLRRNPDIKWRQDSQSLERMPQIQKRLLQEYSHLVAPGGRLVYGVCSFRQAETTQIVESFLRENSHFDLIEGGYFGPGPCDGFFMQAFVRKAEGNKR